MSCICGAGNAGHMPLHTPPDEGKGRALAGGKAGETNRRPGRCFVCKQGIGDRGTVYRVDWEIDPPFLPGEIVFNFWSASGL